MASLVVITGTNAHHEIKEKLSFNRILRQILFYAGCSIRTLRNTRISRKARRYRAAIGILGITAKCATIQSAIAGVVPIVIVVVGIIATILHTHSSYIISCNCVSVVAN